MYPTGNSYGLSTHYCCNTKLSKLQMQHCAIRWTRYFFKKKVAKTHSGQKLKVVFRNVTYPNI